MRDQRPPVAALRYPMLVTEHSHQDSPSARGSFGTPFSIRWPLREAVPRDRWNDDVERVGCIAAMRDRVGQWTDNVEKLYDGTGPAVRQDDGKGARVRRTDMQEMDFQPVDLHVELRISVDPLLEAAPIVPVLPMVDQSARR